MADSKDSHVVVIPVDSEHEKSNFISAIQHHPLMEIAQSPGHLLLLKLWQREEEIFAKEITIKETKLDSIKRELFQLSFFFFLFHFLFLTIIFTSSVRNGPHEHYKCKNWWTPALLSAVTSIIIVSLVHNLLYRFWKVLRQLTREKNDNRALTRCIQELRMKGVNFDLDKQPHIGKRMKSSSVEIKWKPISWCSEYVVTICLVCFAGLVFPASKLILCVF